VGITIVLMVFIILMLFVDNMLVASTSMVKINMLAQLAWTYEMKDLGAAKQSWAWMYTKRELMVSFLVITVGVHSNDTQEFWYE